MLLIAALAAAAAGGWVALRLRVPGGVIVGGMVGAAAVSLGVGEVPVPLVLRVAVFTGIGLMVGMLVNRTTLRALRSAALPAIGAACVLIVGGIGLAYLLRAIGQAPPGDMLATSPGTLSVLVATAVDHDVGAPSVALFHLTRLVVVILTLPLLLRLLPKEGTRPSPATLVDDLEATMEGAAGDGGHAGRLGRGAKALRLLVTAVAATVGALLVMAFVPGSPLVLGSTVGAALATLGYRTPMRCPRPIGMAVQGGLGAILGSLVTPASLEALRAAVVPSLLAAVLIIALGMGISFGLRRLGLAPPGDLLATSPGAMPALTSAAADYNTGPIHVTLFHTVRILCVMLSLPLLLALLR